MLAKDTSRINGKYFDHHPGVGPTELQGTKKQWCAANREKDSTVPPFSTSLPDPNTPGCFENIQGQQGKFFEARVHMIPFSW